MIRATKLSLMLLAAAVALSTSASHADRGVAVSLGRIAVQDRLAPGGAYLLPTLGVTNTGSEPGDYEVAITYLQDQKEMRPPEDWFSFQPEHFPLEAGQTQTVRIRLKLPTGADPGAYFAFIEAHPVAEGTGVAIGVAAATKLTFVVKPSNWFEAQRVRFERSFRDAEPWSYLVPLALLATILLFMLRRLFRIRIRLERR